MAVVTRVRSGASAGRSGLWLTKILAPSLPTPGMKRRTVGRHGALKSNDCGKPDKKRLAILFCCLLFFVLSSGTNPVAAARYKLRQQGDNNDCFCCIPSDGTARSSMRSPPSTLPPGCFQRLGAIGLMCRMEEEPSPVLDI